MFSRHDRGEPLLVVTFGTDTNVDQARRLLHRLADNLREAELPF